METLRHTNTCTGWSSKALWKVSTYCKWSFHVNTRPQICEKYPWLKSLIQNSWKCEIMVNSHYAKDCIFLYAASQWLLESGVSFTTWVSLCAKLIRTPRSPSTWGLPWCCRARVPEDPSCHRRVDGTGRNWQTQKVLQGFLQNGQRAFKQQNCVTCDITVETLMYLLCFQELSNASKKNRISCRKFFF